MEPHSVPGNTLKRKDPCISSDLSDLQPPWNTKFKLCLKGPCQEVGLERPTPNRQPPHPPGGDPGQGGGGVQDV